MTEPADNPAPPPPMRRASWRVLVLAVALVVVVAAVFATTPFWAPTVVTLLPWGPAPAPPQPQPRPRPQPQPQPQAKAEPDLGGRVAALEAQEARQREAAVQRLDQRVAALEARPVADLAPMRQQLATLSGAVADLTARLAAIDKAVRAEAASDPGTTAMVLVLLQIGEAVEVARPFAAEYNTLAALARTHPEIAAAAAPLAAPAVTGVASRAALAERLRQLAPRIATATTPSANPGWRTRITAELRGLVTVRRIDGAGQSPAEAAVATAQHELAGGDLADAVAALEALSGANAAAAQPWLAMARRRLQVETTLRRVEALAVAQLGAAAAAPADTAR